MSDKKHIFFSVYYKMKIKTVINVLFKDLSV